MHTRVFQSDCAENPQILVLFYEDGSVFSNSHPANFTANLNGKATGNGRNTFNFTCSEQFFMYQKALFVGDKIIAKKILQETDPMEMKMLGRSFEMSKTQLEKLDFFSWSVESRHVMFRACYEKFSQNKEMLQMLFRTHGMKLVEASPTDKIWGIGLSKDDRRARSLRHWKGSNRLGEVLDNVRRRLMQDRQFFVDLLKTDNETLTTRCQLLESPS